MLDKIRGSLDRDMFQRIKIVRVWFLTVVSDFLKYDAFRLQRSMELGFSGSELGLSAVDEKGQVMSLPVTAPAVMENVKELVLMDKEEAGKDAVLRLIAKAVDTI